MLFAKFYKSRIAFLKVFIILTVNFIVLALIGFCAEIYV